jgi:hypothetical protein
MSTISLTLPPYCLKILFGVNKTYRNAAKNPKMIFHKDFDISY